MNQRDTSSSTIHVLSIGDFGRAVAAHLKALGPRVLETVVNDHTVPLPHLWPLCDVIVLAGWRSSPNLCELVEELSYARQWPFVPVFQVAGLLRLGPVVVPGEGPCWTCWTQRLKQHAEWPDAEAALLEHYARQADAGPRGFLEPFALMAAARLSQTIQQLSTRQAIAGQVWQIHMLTREITRSQVIGIHGCARCGLHRAESARSFDPMREELAYLWASDGGKG
jgi:bacteriocin biosynthesis cyclodehydratase domain-containing protein